MLRPFTFLATLSIAAAASSQPPAKKVPGAADECLIRADAPSAWMIEGYDPFSGTAPEATFAITFTNEGSGECQFAPVFRSDQPPFGLSRGTGRSIGYSLLNLTETDDVTPRVGQAQRGLSDAEGVLKAGQSQTMLFKFVVHADDIRESGTFTEDVTVEMQDDRFRSLGGTRLLLGINVLPSARLGLSGAFTMNDGHAVVDLGELRQGPAPVPLQLRVSSTGRYTISASSANAGRLRLGGTDWYVPYEVAIGGNALSLSGAGTVAAPAGDSFRRDSLPIHFMIGDVSDRRAGIYSDVISISVSAQ
jgi:hypothetical protein